MHKNAFAELRHLKHYRVICSTGIRRASLPMLRLRHPLPSGEYRGEVEVEQDRNNSNAIHLLGYANQTRSQEVERVSIQAHTHTHTCVVE
jgi:hypothetical protein